jgi:hypothetical protein
MQYKRKLAASNQPEMHSMANEDREKWIKEYVER